VRRRNCLSLIIYGVDERSSQPQNFSFCINTKKKCVGPIFGRTDIKLFVLACFMVRLHYGAKLARVLEENIIFLSYINR
jgi:hypothetical protein